MFMIRTAVQFLLASTILAMCTVLCAAFVLDWLVRQVPVTHKGTVGLAAILAIMSAAVFATSWAARGRLPNPQFVFFAFPACLATALFAHGWFAVNVGDKPASLTPYSIQQFAAITLFVVSFFPFYYAMKEDLDDEEAAALGERREYLRTEATTSPERPAVVVHRPPEAQPPAEKKPLPPPVEVDDPPEGLSGAKALPDIDEPDPGLPQLR